VSTAAESKTSVDAEEFVRFFSEGWQKPKPDAFLEHFAARMAAPARMIQPLAPTTEGIERFKALFRRLFEAFPDYEVRVEDWAASGNTVYLWLTHSATIGSRKLSWPGVDRVVLDAEGRITEREAIFDPTVQLPALLRAPRLWPRLARTVRSR
jgi:hypothetical protein